MYLPARSYEIFRPLHACIPQKTEVCNTDHRAQKGIYLSIRYRQYCIYIFETKKSLAFKTAYFLLLCLALATTVTVSVFSKRKPFTW